MRLTPRRRSSFQLSPTETVLIVPIEYNEIQWYNDGWTRRWLDIISFFSLNIQVTVMAPVIIRDVHNALHCQQCQCVDEVDRHGQIIEDCPTRGVTAGSGDYWREGLVLTLRSFSFLSQCGCRNCKVVKDLSFLRAWAPSPSQQSSGWTCSTSGSGDKCECPWSGISTNLHSHSSCFFFVYYLTTMWRHLTRRLYRISKS